MTEIINPLELLQMHQLPEEQLSMTRLQEARYAFSLAHKDADWVDYGFRKIPYREAMQALQSLNSVEDLRFYRHLVGPLEKIIQGHWNAPLEAVASTPLWQNPAHAARLRHLLEPILAQKTLAALRLKDAERLEALCRLPAQAPGLDATRYFADLTHYLQQHIHLLRHVAPGAELSDYPQRARAFARDFAEGEIFLAKLLNLLPATQFANLRDELSPALCHAAQKIFDAEPKTAVKLFAVARLLDSSPEVKAQAEARFVEIAGAYVPPVPEQTRPAHLPPPLPTKPSQPTKPKGKPVVPPPLNPRTQRKIDPNYVPPPPPPTREIQRDYSKWAGIGLVVAVLIIFAQFFFNTKSEVSELSEVIHHVDDEQKFLEEKARIDTAVKQQELNIPLISQSDLDSLRAIYLPPSTRLAYEEMVGNTVDKTEIFANYKGKPEPQDFPIAKGAKPFEAFVQYKKAPEDTAVLALKGNAYWDALAFVFHNGQCIDHFYVPKNEMVYTRTPAAGQTIVGMITGNGWSNKFESPFKTPYFKNMGKSYWMIADSSRQAFPLNATERYLPTTDALILAQFQYKSRR
ncbi:MAG: hypothetical protein J0L99_20505 [Chitinophagales bacterium]|nr:hypothetical protein [Chitinophagales bacterium]